MASNTSTDQEKTTLLCAAIGTSAAALGLGYWLFMSPRSQRFGSFPYRASTTEKVVALSFDDGPNEPYTSQIATFLRSRSVQATFFQVGRCVERYPDVTLRLSSEGHVIGSHSYSHKFWHCLSWSRQREDIEKGQQTLARLLGRRTRLFRPPWLFRHPWMLRSLRAQGMQPVSGVFGHLLEVFQPRPEAMAARAVAKVRPGTILIFHDGFDARGGSRGRTVAAVKLVVDHLLEQGYHFTTIDRLLAVPG
ncbi:MAG: polysaccharide deacetylase family protein [Acidimicrobiales bacterium]